jgi:hypothetical protein
VAYLGLSYGKGVKVHLILKYKITLESNVTATIIVLIDTGIGL